MRWNARRQSTSEWSCSSNNLSSTGNFKNPDEAACWEDLLSVSWRRDADFSGVVCGGSHADWTLWRRVEISVPSRKCRSALFFPWNKVYSSDLTDAIAATLTARGAAIVVVFFQSLLSLKWSHESQPASTSSRYSLVETERGFCLRTPKSAPRNHAAAC